MKWWCGRVDWFGLRFSLSFIISWQVHDSHFTNSSWRPSFQIHWLYFGWAFFRRDESAPTKNWGSVEWIIDSSVNFRILPTETQLKMYRFKVAHIKSTWILIPISVRKKIDTYRLTSSEIDEPSAPLFDLYPISPVAIPESISFKRTLFFRIPSECCSFLSSFTKCNVYALDRRQWHRRCGHSAKGAAFNPKYE